MRFSKAQAAAIVAALPLAYAQTSTDCNPTEKTCPKDVGLNSATFSSDFASDPKAKDSWSTAAYTTINYDNQGAQFRIAKQGQAPTIQSNFYFFFGHVDVVMKPAPGQGIISSIVLESDDLDEIDWEFLGGVDSSVQTNFFGKGNTTSYDRMIQYNVDTPQETWHTYSLDWTAERLQWLIDGAVVRELKYTDSVALGGKTYPQTPMRLKLGNWAGGGEGQPEGTIQWAGGKTDFSKSPFDMYVQKVSIQNYNPADSYEYGDLTGSWQSIKINKDGSSTSPSGSGSATSGSGSTTSDVGFTATSTAGSNATTPDASSTTSSADSENAYTSKASVQAISEHTEAANSVTQTGSMYSTNTASASALNSEIAASTMQTSAVSGSSPTGSPAGSGNSTSYQSPTKSGSGAAEQTGNAAASLKGGMAAGSVVGLALGVFLL